jgi:hypothetical protein
VRALVSARHFQRACVATNHDMAQRDCGGAAGERRQTRERSAKRRAVRFDDAINHRCTPTSHECNHHHEADERRRTRPEVAKKPAH